jgi:predicted nucleic acid-binding protein
MYELQAVLSREKFRRYITLVEVREYVQWLGLGERAAGAADHTPGFVAGAVPDDPDDEYLVGLAAHVRADYLVSGDPHLIGLPGRVIKDEEGRVLARMLTPREFLEELQGSR